MSEINSFTSLKCRREILGLEIRMLESLEELNDGDKLYQKMLKSEFWVLIDNDNPWFKDIQELMEDSFFNNFCIVSLPRYLPNTDDLLFEGQLKTYVFKGIIDKMKRLSSQNHILVYIGCGLYQNLISEIKFKESIIEGLETNNNNNKNIVSHKFLVLSLETINCVELVSTHVSISDLMTKQDQIHEIYNQEDVLCHYLGAALVHLFPFITENLLARGMRAL